MVTSRRTSLVTFAGATVVVSIGSALPVPVFVSSTLVTFTCCVYKVVRW